MQDFNFLSGGQGSSDCAEKNGELCIPKYWIRKDIAGLRSDHTGKFVCSGKSQNNNLTSSFSIYVEGVQKYFMHNTLLKVCNSRTGIDFSVIKLLLVGIKILPFPFFKFLETVYIILILIGGTYRYLSD